MRRSNCSDPPPPGHLRGHHFVLGCPGLLITLFLSYHALHKHYNHSFFHCAALFYHTHFSSDPGAAPSGGIGPEQFDRRITTLIAAVILFAFGSGPVKGFAITLGIGIITTLFTAYFLARHLTSLVVLNTKNKEIKI